MARSVQISDNFSVKHEPNFFNFLINFSFQKAKLKNLADSQISLNFD